MNSERVLPVGLGDGCDWRSVDARVDLHCRQTPHAIAIEARGEQLSYAGFADRIAARAAYLAERVPAGGRVAICVERTVDMPAWLIAIIRIGAAYVPIDPTLPPTRIAQVLKRAAPALILVAQTYRDVLPPTEVPIAIVDDPAAPMPLDARATLPMHVPHPDDLAYIIFTSGSTGEPKGVEIQHGALAAMLDAFAGALGHARPETLLCLTRISFDLSVVDLFLPPTTGGRLVLLDLNDAADPARLAAGIADHAPDMIQATPATWRALLEAGWQGAAQLRLVCGGEAMTRDLADRLLPRCRELWNAYGPTETTVWSAVQRVTVGSDPVGIGRPIPGTIIRIADPDLREVPHGDVAEIVIAGPSVARGYAGRDDLTAERFVTLDTGARAYRTGDLGRVGEDGCIYCLGRLDDQVKVRGFRMELGDIESALTAHPDVAWGAARVWPDQHGETILVAYVVPRVADTLTPATVKTFLSTRLPGYMIPSRIVTMVDMPLTPNGKVDRSALPNPLGAQAAVPASPPGNAAELRMAAIWCALLGVAEVAANDDFFDLGGYSLITVRLMRQIEQEFGRTVELIDLIRASTLSAMTTLVTTPAQATASHAILLNPQAETPAPARPPLYWLDAGPLMRGMARGVAADQPVFALNLTSDDEGALGQSAFDIAAVAAVARRRLVEVQPSGPYQIGGWCRWGVVAQELACQLRDHGQDVALLVMLDADAPGHRRTQMRVRSSLRHLKRLFTGRSAPQPDAGSAAEASFSQRVEQAMHRHQPRRFDGHAVLLRAGEMSHGRADGDWRTHVDHLAVETVPGTHESMVRAPHVTALGETLDRSLMTAQSRSAPVPIHPLAAGEPAPVTPECVAVAA